MFTNLCSGWSSLRIALHAEDGQTLTEYGMMVAFIAIVVIAAAILLGTDISNLFAPLIQDF